MEVPVCRWQTGKGWDPALNEVMEATTLVFHATRRLARAYSARGNAVGEGRLR
jgi:hypothetical protein